MKNDENVDLLYATRISLTERSLEELKCRLEKKTGLPVRRYEELVDEGGYVFYGDYNIPIGDVVYDPRQNAYRGLSYRIGAKQQIEAERKKRMVQEKRRHLKVQRNRRIGVAIAAAGIVALIGYGVIHLPSPSREAEPVTVASPVTEERTTSIVDADDLVLVEWSNYAIGEVLDICHSSPYESLSSQYDIVYHDYFVPVMQNYYNYLDYLDQEMHGFPPELTASSKKKTHDSFRDYTLTFDSYLESSAAFQSFTFANSPYAYSLLVDKDGNVIDGEDGVVFGEDGQVIAWEDKDSYDVYIKASAVPGERYTLANLPSDAILVNGEAYVDAAHLYDETKTITK